MKVGNLQVKFSRVVLVIFISRFVGKVQFWVGGSVGVDLYNYTAGIIVNTSS